MIRRKKNVAGYVDERGVFRPIRSPKYVGTPKRRATAKDRKKYSRAKAGDLGKAKQERALEDVFQREIRLQNEEREHKARVMKQIERETLGDSTETTKGRTLVEFIRSQGGIRPGYKFGGKKNRGKRISYDAGELAPLTYKESGKRGLVSDKGKLSLDRMFQSAREAGYAVADTWDLLSAMQDEINGGKVTYSNRGYMDYRDNPARFSWRKNAHNWALLHDGEALAYLTHNSGRSYTVKISRGDDKTFQAQSLAAAKSTALAFARKGFAGYRDYKNSQPSVAYVNRIISKAAIAKHGKVTRIVPAAFSSDKYEIVFADGYSQESRIPKTNGVLVGDRENKSDLYVTQLGPRSFGVFLKTYLLKKFTTKLGAMKHIQSIRTKAKKNPSAADPEKVIRRKFAQYLDIRGYKEMAKELRAGADIRKTIKTVYGWEPPTFKKKLKIFEALLPKKNPIDPIGTFANITVGLASAMQINDMLKKKPAKRKGRVTPKTNGRTTAKRKNPHGDMPSGARFNEKLFDQDLAAIEDGNFRLIRSANAHGKLAGYRKPEIDRLVQRARLAFQLKEMYARKNNPTDIATLLAPLKTNGAFKRMLQRRKAASALKRELKLERALEKTRAKKRKAISAATANPKSRAVGKKTVTRSANPKRPKRKIVQIGRTSAVRTPLGTDRSKARSGLLKLGYSPTEVREILGPVAERKKKSNPSATAKKPPRSRLHETFQGRPVTGTIRRTISRHAPAKVVQLGDLIEIKVVGEKPWKVNPSRVKLTAANGRLWIVGRKFAKESKSAKANELNPIGEIDHVVYRTFKPHHGDAPRTHYIHKLGEESGKRPLLCVDKEGFAVIRGGNYKIEARGIVD